jgi:mannose-6-phosphate isomerase-like protein (cupin superfamily)
MSIVFIAPDRIVAEPVSEKLLEVHDYTKEGYSPVVDYAAWRVAVLNYSNDFLPGNITSMQRHDETDEVFVLLHGHCILFIGDGDKEVTDIFAEKMRPFKIYNVKKSVWHMHTLSMDAKVLIVENRNTTFDNSPFCPLTGIQRKMIVDMTLRLWIDEGI